MPAVEAIATVGWVRPSAARRQRLCVRGGACRGGVGATAVERKAGGRSVGGEGVREVRRSAVAVAGVFFIILAIGGERRERIGSWTSDC